MQLSNNLIMTLTERRYLLMDEHVKELGTYTAEIVLHKEVKVNINFEVFAE